MTNRWSREEEANLVRNISLGKTYNELADKFNRTEYALEFRFKKILYENITNGKQTSELSKVLHLPINTIEQYYYSYKEYLENKNKQLNKYINNTIHSNLNKPETNNNFVLPIQQLSLLKSENKILNESNLPKSENKILNESKTINDVINKINIIPSVNNIHQSGGTIQNTNYFESLENENRLLKAILKNKKLRDNINILAKKENLDHRTKKLLKRLKHNI